MGAGSDLEIKHTGSHSYLMDSGTGDLYVAGSTVYISNAATDEIGLKFVQDGAVDLYHNNVVKLATSAAGGTLTGVWVQTANIADDAVTQAKMANDSVGSAEMKTLSTLLIKNSGGSTLATFHTAGA